MTQIHGHEVINFIKNSKPAIKKEDLLSTIEKAFGDAKFHTCSKENMSAKELLEFLEMADKLYFVNNHARIKTSNVCNHEH